MNPTYHPHAGQEDQQLHIGKGCRLFALAGALASIITTLAVLARAAGLSVGF